VFLLLLQEPPLLSGLVQQQLQQLAASSRTGAALVILQWLLHVVTRMRSAVAAADAATAAAASAAVAASTVSLAAQIAGCVPEQLPDSCLAYLGASNPSQPSYPATEPYTELAASYVRLRKEMYGLMNVCLGVSETKHGHRRTELDHCLQHQLKVGALTPVSVLHPGHYVLQKAIQDIGFLLLVGLVLPALEGMPLDSLTPKACLTLAAVAAAVIVCSRQVGLVLPAPEGMPLEALTPEACLLMAAAVPPEVDVGDVRLAKATVQSTAAELQVKSPHSSMFTCLSLGWHSLSGGCSWLAGTCISACMAQFPADGLRFSLTPCSCAPCSISHHASPPHPAHMPSFLRTQATESYLHTSALLVLASAVVAGGRLPAKLNCVLQNLMAGLRKEPVRELQDVAAQALAELMAGCAARQPCPNDKLVKNLCGMLCGDPSETPCAATAEDTR
jgi:hypothetical protein